MIRLLDPIHAVEGCPIKVGPYTFRNARTRRTVDFTNDFILSSVVCQLKQRSASTYAETVGTVVSYGGGIVQVDTYTFTSPGEWQYQFFALDASGNRLAGEPVYFDVRKRVQDAGTNEFIK